MIPTTNSNPSLMTITGTDLNKVRAIYGSEGFYAFSSKSAPLIPTPTPTPIIPIKPIIPINPFESITISNELIVVKKYESNYAKITGQIDEDVFLKGHPLYVLVKKPDHSFDTHKIQSTATGYFELPLVFDDKSTKGWYSVEASYLEHIDRSMNFDFKVVSEFSQNTPKTKNFVFPAPEISSGPSKYGKYFDDISITVNGDKYTVTSQLSKNLPSKQIRISAENECPFKKQVYEKDFRNSMGTKTSFSFYQSSHGKPTNCSIHFTITDFEGSLLDTTKVDYNSQTKKQNDLLSETKKPENKINNNPIFTDVQKQKMKLQNEAAILQQESYFKLEDFKNDVLVSKKSLEQVSVNSPEQQKTIDKAWKLLKSNQIILKNITERFQKGDGEISNEKYDSVSYLFDIRSHESKSIGENLVEISRLIEESKSQIKEESTHQSCFLMWCW